MRWILIAALALMPVATDAAPVIVRGVAANDMLNLRATPDAKAAMVATLAPNATGITITAVDSKGVEWVKIAKGNNSGWVNAKFLAYENGLPVRLSCTGTEPFWSIAIGYGVADAQFNGDKTKLALDEPQSPDARSHPWLFPVHGEAQSFLVLEKTGNCSDGMSDNTYPYSLLVRTENQFVEGCCR